MIAMENGVQTALFLHGSMREIGAVIEPKIFVGEPALPNPKAVSCTISFAL